MKPPRICIVEDDPIIGADLADRLQELGYVPEGPFASGEKAFAHMQAHWPDLVILDIQLEGQWDGIATARRILEHKPLPIIFLTANSDDATFKKAKLTSPAAFMSKPFRRRDLEHAIELALSRMAGDAPLPTGLAGTAASSYLLDDRIFIKTKDGLVRVMLEDICWVEADDYACRAATPEREFFIGRTLGKFSEALASRPEFMRVHRSYIVNLKHVEQIGDIQLKVGKKEIPLSKTLKEELLARIQKI
jgi:DNA-binding LytR/AlgR family response regulator